MVVDELEELRNHVAQKIGPIAKPANIVFTPELPKTRSGKIMRRLLRDVANNRRLGDTTTLAAEDPAALRAALVSHQRQIAIRDSELRASREKLQRLIDGRETIMGMRSESLQTEDHRRLGIDLYNRTWTLMDSPGDEMLHCAHASAYHWMQGGGTTANRARSEWLCSRVYSILGRPEPALHHARRCLELVESAPTEMEDWDIAGAHEALARAHLVAGETDEARRNYELAREDTAKIADPEDAKHIEADLDALPL